MIVLLFKRILRYISLGMVKYIPWIQGMCSEVVHIEPRSLTFIPDYFKTQRMCERAVENDPYTLEFVPAHLRTFEMRKRAVEKYLYPMRNITDLLRHRRCATKQSKNIHGSWVISQIISKPKGYVKKWLKMNQEA